MRTCYSGTKNLCQSMLAKSQAQKRALPLVDTSACHDVPGGAFSALNMSVNTEKQHKNVSINREQGGIVKRR